MPISVLEYDTIQLAASLCKMVLTDLQPRLLSMQAQYDSAGGVKETLTQEELDSQAALSGLTKAQMDDAAYALTAVLLPGITNSYAALSQLASRCRGFAPPPPMPLP